jgi:two-component system nitrogen regulation response regulator NtrX
VTQPAEVSIRPRLLVVEDEPGFRASLRRTLEEAGYETVEASDGKTALDVLRHDLIDLVLLDLRLPRVSGMEVLRRIADEYPGLAVVILSAYGTVPAAVEATRLGALEFLEKDHDEVHTLRVVREALARTVVRGVGRRSGEEVWKRYSMIGSSPAIQRVYDLIDRLAPAEAPVLLEGESGTGKNHVAGAIHRNSSRAAHRLIEVNCASIPSELVEAELFGHVRGSFTGAVTNRVGLVELAHRGTLFLNEIGDMALAAQSKLLQALDTGRIRRVGGATDVPVDFRLMAATNKNLEAEVSEGRFREDLYFRLNVLRIHVPPLRERREDVPALARHFVDDACQRNRLRPRQLHPAALRILLDYDWPGNVRELRNVVERMAILAESSELGARDAHAAIRKRAENGEQLSRTLLKEARDAFDAEFIERALREHEYRIQQTADALGINRTTLWKILRRLGIALPGRD